MYRVDAFELNGYGYLDHVKLEFNSLGMARSYVDSIKTRYKSIFILKKNAVGSYDVLEQIK